MSRYFVALILALLTLALSTAAKERPVPAPAEQGRVVVSLDDAWSFAVDPTGDAPTAEWATGPPSPTTKKLPHSWTQSDRGAAWYAREITFPGAGEQVEAQLNLDHPVGALDVFLDGKPAAQFVGNGLPQHMRLQGKGGSTHRLALRLGRTGLPPTTRSRSIYGLGHISIELLPAARIETLGAVLDPAKKTLSARYRLFATNPITASLKLEVLSADGKHVLGHRTETCSLSAAGVEGEQLLPIKHMLCWSPRQPDRTYRLRVTLLVAGRVVDARELTCGACAVAFTGTILLINGQPVQLKGVRLPGGIPLIYRPTLEETLQNELELARKAGFNAIMADGSALPEEVLAMADALGMLVIGEIPCGEGGAPQIRATLDACAHHPCVIAWSWAGAGAQAQQIADLRALDPFRLILLRDGTRSRLIGPRDTTGQTITDLDLNLPDEMADTWWGQLRQIEEERQPVLVTGLGVAMAPSAESPSGSSASIRGNTLEGDRALGLLRGTVESLRCGRQFPLLGYFVRLPQAETLTGLSTRSGNPTNALTTSVAYNQPCAIFLRVKSPVVVAEQTILDAAIVNADRMLGEYQLYEVVTTPDDGRTAITSRKLDFTSKTTQLDLLKYLSFVPDHAGEYRLQLVLSQGDRVIASTQVARITVSSAESASLVTPSNR